jgi:hypothetical protein
MGGPGSGSHHHWWRSSKKTDVEKCLQLDASRWRRDGIIRAGAVVSGTWRWTYHSGRRFAINYEVDTVDLSSASVRLWYSWIRTATKQHESADYRVRLATTRPRFGGLRWWFVCPLVVNGRPCGRRVGKLYMPPDARYFGCRRCHDLTYRSAQEHDKRVDVLRRNPQALMALAENPGDLDFSLLGLVLKAIRLGR